MFFESVKVAVYFFRINQIFFKWTGILGKYPIDVFISIYCFPGFIYHPGSTYYFYEVSYAKFALPDMPVAISNNSLIISGAHIRFVFRFGIFNINCQRINNNKKFLPAGLWGWCGMI